MTQVPSADCLPTLIQGGMGVAISSWPLASAVAKRGHLGVVSGTAIERVIVIRLQEGDVGGHLRRAFDAFPVREVADRVYARFHRPDGLETPGVYKAMPMFGGVKPSNDLLEAAVVGAFAEVWLAKEGHSGPIGINLLEKIQAPTLPFLYGAILAGADYVLMGAGIPREIPGHMDALCQHKPCELRLYLEDGSEEMLPFDPSIIGCDPAPVARPKFLAIVSSHVLAVSLSRSGGVDGFIVEGPKAGGHNAPPRGWTVESGEEPVYGDRDDVKLDRIRRLGLPFWLAGEQDHATAIPDAQELGAVGIQVGTAFALCSESGMDPDLRKQIIAEALEGKVVTKTEGRGSPTGFPFKTIALEGTAGAMDPDGFERQACTLGYLRTAYRKDDGGLGWRCPAEPVKDYVAKGGDAADCAGRRCLCRGLIATTGHPLKAKNGEMGLPLVTAGFVRDIKRFLGEGTDYNADAVIDYFGIPDGPAAISNRTKSCS